MQRKTTMRLKGKCAIVTGGGNGIGAGCARRLAAEGAQVLIADIDDAGGAALAAELGSGARYVHTDVSQQAAVEALMNAALESCGSADILVNNAAFVHKAGVVENFLDYNEAAWQRTLAVNLSGMFYCSQATARLMAQRGQGGSIINISSGGATRAHRHMFGYDTSKGGIEAATRAMALDLAGVNIRVNCVVPGSTRVDNGTAVGDSPMQPGAVIPLARQGTPADIAAAVAFLASDDAAYITGTRIVVDGGMDAQLRSPAVDFSYDFSAWA
ncbi:MAG: SDR family oxidoreductase [Chloroflexi bacterium]|nr:SDR family oxidoreductase [Chloroflexota bacterium]MCY3582966.1 SDR family oxidoreductase [Chloroflexota bacterium]MCY3716870.1 SDR family oxidoreductase [Chloroflexota bacterium]MDE2649261.1 SDR family oxidoreductase [Chloroflexota bacterium]